MTISAVEIDIPNTENVSVTADSLSVDLSDGRTISVPLARFPLLLHATPKERKKLETHRQRAGHPLEGLLAGRPSGESQESFQK